MKTRYAFSLTFLLVLIPFHSHTSYEVVALAGGTLIDVSEFGESQRDISDSVVLLKGNRIAAVGKRKSLRIPEGAKVFDLKGKYILPGLIDGFAALDNQSYANAYLFMGITSIVGIYGGRRAPLFEDANPCPDVYTFGYVGEEEVTTQDMLKRIEAWAKKGVKFLLLHYELRPDQTKAAIKKAHELGMAAVGELGYTPYKDAVKSGIDALVHSIRYSVELSPPNLRSRVASQPFGPPAKEFRRWLAALNPEDASVIEYAHFLGVNSAGLLPTLILGCISLPFLDNPWEESVAAILDPGDIHYPVNRSTGKHDFPASVMREAIREAENILRIEHQYFKGGARYLAGSGTDVFGTMPGISLHQELELLTKIGLSERQALAAATGNFAAIFGWKEIGRIKEGCRANILVVEKNPLENIKNLKNIHMVILAGKIIDREKLLFH